MPYNGNGIFARIHTWANEAASGTPILPGEFDEQEQDFAAAFGNCITRDGQGGPTADIPWNNFGITGLRGPQLAGDAANKAYVDTATGARSMGGFKITNLADPTNPQDAATKAYVGGTTTQLPDQPGYAGQFLLTNGLLAAWAWAQNMPRSARIANTALAVTDRATLIDITANTFTQTFAAAATLGNGWYCLLRNNGTGDITLDPNGAELIDGLTSYVVYAGEARLIQCDGTKFYSIVLRPFSKTFTSSGTFTKPPGYSYFGGFAWGGGGSGASCTTGAYTCGGGAGAGCLPFSFPANFISPSETVTIGAGGAAVPPGASGNPGNTGGNTTLGNAVIAYGATGGNVAASNATGGVSGGVYSPGTGPSDSFNTSLPGSAQTHYGGGGGGNSNSSGSYGVYGAAGGSGSWAQGTIFPGATSRFAGNGGANSTTNGGSAVAGTAPGGGGGAGTFNATGAAGARGELRIWGQV